METVQRLGPARTLPKILGVWVVVATLGEMIRSSEATFDGNGPAIVRTILAIGGLAAAALFWGRQDGGQLGVLAILVWGMVQVPFYASEPDGNFTRQFVDVFLGVSSSTTVNGEFTEYSQVGFNLVGVVVMLVAYRVYRRVTVTDA